MKFALISRTVFSPREIPSGSEIYVPIIANTAALEDRLGDIGRSVSARSINSLLEIAGTGSSVTIVPDPIAAEILALGDQRADIIVYELGEDFSLSAANTLPVYQNVIENSELRIGRTIFGGEGIDFLGGSNDGEMIIGGASGDFIATREGNNKVFAGASDRGDDLIIAGDGNDVLGGGPGDDIVLGYKGRDAIFGGPGADSLFGTDTDAGPSDHDNDPDTIWAGAGDDFVQGADGADLLGGGFGNDTIYSIGGADTIYGGADAGEDVIFGDFGDDVIYGGGGNDVLLGGSNDDIIFNGAGSDVVNGENGDDTMWGGAGDDFFLGGDHSSVDNDTYAFVPGSGTDVISAFDIYRDKLWFAEGPESLTDIQMVDAGLDLELRAEGMVIILRDVEESTLSSDNFLFG